VHQVVTVHVVKGLEKVRRNRPHLGHVLAGETLVAEGGVEVTMCLLQHHAKPDNRDNRSESDDE